MNGVLELASEFFERAASPLHAPEVNDRYGERLQSLLREDDELAALLSRLELSPDDVPLLSLDVWLWYLRWRPELPDDDFLDALFQTTGEPVVHLRIVELVVRSPNVSERLAATSPDAPPWPVDELPVPWLRPRLQRALAGVQDDKDREGAVAELRTIMRYLFQLGDPASFGVLRALVADPRARDVELGAFAASLLRAGARRRDTAPLPPGARTQRRE